MPNEQRLIVHEDSPCKYSTSRLTNGRTGLTVTLRYELPGGELGVVVARWLEEDPASTIAADLQRFKEEMEAGVFSQFGGEEKV